jgi:hypothetical protein
VFQVSLIPLAIREAVTLIGGKVALSDALANAPWLGL